MFRLALHWQILIGVVLAASLGLSLSASVGTRESKTPLGNGQFLSVFDSVNRIDIKIVDENDKTIQEKYWRIDLGKGEYLRVEDSATPALKVGDDKKTQVVKEKHWVVDPTGKTKGSFTTLAMLKKKEPKVHSLFMQHGRSQARVIGDWGDKLGSLFLRMLKMVSVPLIITSLMSGVLGLSDAGRLRKLFGVTMTYYIVTSMLAIVTGIFLVNLIQPGHIGQTPSAEQIANTEGLNPDLGETIFEQVEKLIPANPIEAVAASDFLSIIAFTLVFGTFTIMVGGKVLQVFKELFDAGFAVMMTMTMAIVHLAPFGVFFLMLSATATQGAEVFQSLFWYMLTVFSGLVFHGVVTLPLIVYLFSGRNPYRFAHAMSPALMTAFSSASSNATLPLTMDCVENRAGIDNRIGSFVLPLGATINMDGTALFEAVAVLYIAQLEPNISLTLGQQILVAFTALLASIGAAGIPHAGLVMMVIVLQAVGLPADRIGLILAVDRVLDMCRTTVNVWSDMCGCAVVERFIGKEPKLQVATASEPTSPEALEPATKMMELKER